MPKKARLSLAERSRRFREKRKAELEKLRNENLALRGQLERLTGKSKPETAERRQ
jgi:hypothetical protein